MSILSSKDDDWFDGYRLVPISKGNDKYDWINKKMKNTIVEHNGTKIGGYKIVAAYAVQNAQLWNNYKARRNEIYEELGKKQVVEKRLFHGTDCAEQIAENGFDLRYANKNGMFGKALYFADLSSKSNQYTFGGCNNPCKYHKEICCDKCIRTLLVCRVAIGREHTTKVAMKNIDKPPPSYHTVVGEPGQQLLYREYAIYNQHQAYPGHLVKYKIVNNTACSCTML